MYSIITTCFDTKNVKHKEKFDITFPTRETAEISMLHCVNNEVSDLNMPDANNTPHTRVFIADLNGEHDAIVRMWDGDDYWDVTYYDIMETYKVLLDEYNSKLQEKYGKGIGVHLESYNDNGNQMFYYTSQRYGESDAFDTIEKAYKEACIYLDGVGELW